MSGLPTIESLSTASLPRRALECGRCGAPFECGAGTGADGQCWCAAPAYRLPPDSGLAGGDCLCPDCLAEVAAMLGGGAALAAPVAAGGDGHGGV